jgi:LacI family transcriptional regulator
VDDTPFFPLVMLGAEEECRVNGMEMIIYNLDRRADNYEERVRDLQNDKDSAVILLGTELFDEDIDLIRGMTCPYVVIDYWREDMSFDAMLINNADSARMATEYLIAKGHTKIGYLQGVLRIKPFRSRAAGYQVAMNKASLPIRDEFTITLSTNTDGACADMKKHLAGNPELPTAFFADNDMIALGAMRAMQECGIRIPEDVSVIGFDDLSFSSVSSPPLTTLRVPKQEMGRVAVRRLMSIIHDGDNIRLKMQACTQFVERDSVAAVRQEQIL